MNKKEFHEFIQKQQPNICQITAYQEGKEVFNDEWNDYQKTDTCHVMSATKSIVALLIGIALDQGLIKSIDQPVLDFFPEYKVKRGEKTIQKVTIRHLLTMSAPYKYKYEPWSKICSSDDWTLSALDYLGGRKGLTGEFKYSTLGIHILSGILSKTSGLKVVDFANKYLFEPIGVEKHMNYLAKSAEEHKQFTIGKTPKTNIWMCDPQGVGAAGFGLCLSASDIAKIGQLCLNQGFHNGKQIIASKWIEEITKPTHRCGIKFGNMSYGYLWWIIDEEKPIYAASGNSGNVLYVNPQKHIVIAVTAYFKPTIFDRIEFIQQHIEPFITQKKTC